MYDWLAGGVVMEDMRSALFQRAQEKKAGHEDNERHPKMNIGEDAGDVTGIGSR